MTTVEPRTVAPAVTDLRDPIARLTALFDAGSLKPWGASAGVAAITARGLINGAPVVAFATDPRIQGGALSVAETERVATAIDTAVAENVAVIGLWHSGGAQLAGGVEALDGVGGIFAAKIRASGRIPQISVVFGPAAGGAAYGAALTDLVIMAPAGRVFVTGPGVVQKVTGEDVDMEKLGGPETHGKRSGVVHIVTKTDEEAFDAARTAATLLSQPGTLAPGRPEITTDPGRLLPERPQRAYDMRPIVREILDDAGLELHAKWAPNVVTMLGRLAGRSVGVVANNPLRLGGCLDAKAAEKAARFVRMCDSFGLPLVVLVDVPGYLPGLSQEENAVVRRGAKLLYAFAEAVVPRVTLIVRKAYGGAYIAMNSRSLGATKVLAWPTAEVAVMGAGAAVDILHRRELAGVPEDDRAELRDKLIAEHEQVSGGVKLALATGAVDQVIAPIETRARLVEALRAADQHQRRGSHGNIPL